MSSHNGYGAQVQGAFTGLEMPHGVVAPEAGLLRPETHERVNVNKTREYR